MCNLMGMYLPDGVEFTDELKMLLFSTQVFASRKHGDGFGYYASSDGGDFFKKSHLSAENSRYSKEILGLPENTHWVITHTRRVSSGVLKIPGKDATKEDWTKFFDKKQKFAHPFLCDNVVVAHNGTFLPKDGIEFEMDSMYMAEELSKNLEGKTLSKALDKTFDNFKGGLMSLLIAVKEKGVFVPYIIKGNKLLFKFICKNTGIVILVTDDDFIQPYLAILNKLSDVYFFEAKGSLAKKGIWKPFADKPFIEKDYISYSARNVRISGYTPRVTKTKLVKVPKSQTKFDTFCQTHGIAKLVQITTWILTRLTYEEVRALINLSEGEAVTILEYLVDHKYPTARELLQ